MTKTEDVRRVLKSYAMGQRAIENDIAIVRKYLELSLAERERFRGPFWVWFQMHEKIRNLDWIGSDEFIFPRYAKYLNDAGELIVSMRERQQLLEELEQKLMTILVRPAGQVEKQVSELLQAYADTLQVYVDHRESILAPIALEHYDAKEEKEVERDFRSRLGISGSALILPWMMLKASDEEREYMMSRMPLPFRWWYQKRWEPWYERQIPDFAKAQQ